MRNHCTVDGCDAFVVGHGLCRKHYTRARRGKPIGGTETQKPGPSRTFCSECGAPSVGQGLCELHYGQQVRGPRRRVANASKRTSRSCRRCGDPVPLTKREDSEFCSFECKKKTMNERSAAKPENVERLRSYLYATKFGITIADFDRMLAEQNGRCAICGTDKPGGRGRFHVDHCHESGKVRGILCSRCNTGLGQFQDDTARLLAAGKYLESHPV